VASRAEFRLEQRFILLGFVLGSELIRTIDHVISEMAGGAVDTLFLMDRPGLKILFLCIFLGCMTIDTLGCRIVL
jgi:hypothetical protein